MNDFDDMSENLNVRLVTERGDVIDFEATPEEAEEIKERVRGAFEDDSWNWIRVEKEDGRVVGVSVDEMCAIRFRPYGRGEQFPDSKFVEFNFTGGGFLRAVCEAGQATSLEHLLDEASGGIIEWNAGAHEILVRTEALNRFVIDKHEERAPRPRRQYDDNRRDDRRDFRRNDRNDRNDRRGGGGRRSHRNDRRPSGVRATW